MFVMEILIFALAVLIAKYFWENRRYYYLAYKIPTSSFDRSLRGFYTALTGDNKTVFKLIHDAYDNINVCSKTCVGTMFVGIIKLNDIKLVMNSKYCLDKPYFLKFAKLYQGSLFGHIEYWQSHRKIMNPFFGIQTLRSLFPIFNEKSKILVQSLKDKEGKNEFDVLHFMTALTLETIMKVMEYDFDLQNKETKSRDVFIENLVEYTKIVTLRIWKVWWHPEFIYKYTSVCRRQNDAMTKSTFKFANEMLVNIRQKVKEENNNNKEEDRSKSFIRALIHPKNGLCDSEIIDEIKTVISAAQDTSAIASSTTLLMLAMHKDQQKKVVDELHRVLGTTLDAPYLDYDKVNELEYLEMAINESLRLFPVVPIISRTNTVEIELTDNHILPIGTNIIISMFEIQRRKEYWGDDAEEFHPERFEKEKFKEIHPYAFIPFAKGPRMCIGWRYAMFLMKIQLANVLLKYEIDTTLKYDELEFQFNITMNICQGYKVCIKERKID